MWGLSALGGAGSMVMEGWHLPRPVRAAGSERGGLGQGLGTASLLQSWAARPLLIHAVILRSLLGPGVPLPLLRGPLVGT